jgi:hypothetical protein
MNDSIYLLRVCDICGFKFYKNELIKQDGLWKCRDDYNQPPPSDKPLSGASISGNYRQDSTDIGSTEVPDDKIQAKYTVMDSSNLPIDTTVPFMLVTASAGLINVTLTNI